MKGMNGSGKGTLKEKSVSGTKSDGLFFAVRVLLPQVIGARCCGPPASFRRLHKFLRNEANWHVNPASHHVPPPSLFSTIRLCALLGC
jgi:hypothetical protein